MTSGDRGHPPGQWGSSLGFVLAAAGSAVGLGNLWGFAYRASQGGGAAFVVIAALALAATDPKAEDVVLDMFAGV